MARRIWGCILYNTDTFNHDKTDGEREKEDLEQKKEQLNGHDELSGYHDA
jgi:hypothetical protein